MIFEMIKLRDSLLMAILVAGFLASSSRAQPPIYPDVDHLIDTHIHLYDTTREGGVPWPPPSDKVLYKPHLPAEFHQVSKSAGVTGVVIVEASDRLVDNSWVLNLVSDDDYFVALVGNIDPYREDFTQQLSKLAEDKRFVGVRARNAKPIDYADAKVLENFRALAAHNKSLDFLCNGQGIKGVQDVDALARAVPELTIVVDHVLGYDVDGKLPGKEWLAAVHRLAENKNVYCKVSGLYQRCTIQPAPQEISHYKTLLDVLWKEFGSERLIYGSNWPCTKKSGDYASFVRLVNSYFQSKGQAAVDGYFWKNAAKAYRLDL